MLQPLFIFSEFGLLFLRVALGGILLAHGFPKIRNLKATAGNFASMGFKPGMFWGGMAAAIEFIGGLLLIAGFLTQVVAFFVTVQFLVIILKVRRGQKLVGGYELDLLILAAASLLLTTGGGVYSLENYFQFWLY